MASAVGCKPLSLTLTAQGRRNGLVSINSYLNVNCGIDFRNEKVFKESIRELFGRNIAFATANCVLVYHS